MRAAGLFAAVYVWVGLVSVSGALSAEEHRYSVDAVLGRYVSKDVALPTPSTTNWYLRSAQSSAPIPGVRLTCGGDDPYGLCGGGATSYPSLAHQQRLESIDTFTIQIIFSARQSKKHISQFEFLPLR